MREVKAFVRLSVLEEVIGELKRSGYSCMTIVDIAALGGLIDPKNSKYSIEYVEKASTMAKIELVCSDRDADTVVKIISRSGRTGLAGDGLVYCTPVDRVVKIRTGEEGEAILRK